MTAEYLSQVGSALVKRCGTRDPFEIAKELGIEVLFCENFGPLKGMYRVVKRNRNLTKICGEVFNESNFIGCIILQTATDNNPRQISTEHEYILCYAKNKSIQTAWQSDSEKAQMIQNKYLELKRAFGDDIETIQNELRKWIKKNADTLSGVTHYSIEKCLVAEADGDIVGFIYGFVLPNKTLIPEFMYVVPNARKNGVGAELIKQLELTSGCTASMIFYNKSLHCFYEHQGYLAGENLEVAVKEIGGTSE